MMPLRIELLEYKGRCPDVTVLGIGEPGLKAVSKYPCPAYGERHWGIGTLTLCDDDAFQHKRYPKVTTPKDSPHYLAECRKQVCEIIQNTEDLFVIADINRDPDFDNAFRFANLHRNGSRKGKRTVLINCGEEHTFASLELESVFDLIINVHRSPGAYRPVEMLLSDMYTQSIGLDTADVNAVITRTPEMIYYEETITNEKKIKEIAAKMKAIFERKYGGTHTYNGLLFCLLPLSKGLELVENVYGVLTEELIDGDLMVQMGFHDDEDDKRIVLSVMCGREWIDEKHTADGTHVVEDVPLDF